MPRSPTEKSKVKSEPYASSESPTSSPTKSATSNSGRAKGVKAVSWTSDMDRKLMAHVLMNSDIKLAYNWADLVNKEFPDLTAKQLKSRWDNKLKGMYFPTELLKQTKSAKGAKAKETSPNALEDE